MPAESHAQKSEDDFENKDVLTLFLSTAKRYIFHRNYLLTSKSSSDYLYATVLNTIYFMQMYVVFSLPQYNLAVSQGSDVYWLVEKGVFLLFKLKVETQLNTNSMAIMVLGGIQLLLIAAYVIPISNKQANNIISKYFIEVCSTVTYIPAIYIATQNFINSQSIYISLLTLALTLITRLMYITMHFEFSIQGLGQNILIRNPLSTTNEILSFFLFAFFLLCKSFLYPMSLIVCFIANMAFCLNQVKLYCIGFVYHHEAIPKLIGILKIMKISIALCYLIVIATEITLVKKNILTFIIAFFIFFANFFLIFKKYSTKSIVIDSEGESQTKKIIFIMWYFNCFRNRAEKKNQLYLSSLLKNHSSQCVDVSCCCRKRASIYDPSSNTFGSPASQPHQDIVYIKHFFLMALTQTYKQFPKCNQILFILAFYNLEVLNFIPQTIELIKELKKKSLKKNLTFSEDYLLYCLGERCYSKINEINHVRGNLDLEQVRKFDLKILELKKTIKFSVETFSSLWKTICSQKYNQKNLVQICKVALEVMFKIEETYKEIKSINNVSTELKELMIFYSKSVAHDIHLLSQVRKEIKLNAENTILSNLTEIKEINIFSPDTITLITSEICNIRWASKNCYSIFGYNDRDEFLKLKINDLMPRFFSQNHDNYINKWLETGYSTKLNKPTYLWGSTKQGYCFSLALYIKIIPLQKEQDFAFFAAIQKIDIENQIICNDEGQILGCGKLFASTIRCSQKSIQDYKPNIQIFMPSTSQLFLQKFYPDKKASFQMMVEARRQGYFPNNLETILKENSKEKQSFLSKNGRKPNFNELMCNFLKQKMQQITVYIDGQYISFISTVHELQVLDNKKKKIVIFKLNGFKKNNVEKYYNELEKIIVKLQQTNNANGSLKKRKSLKQQATKEVKRDYFKMFLNPKRVKKILQQEGEYKSQEYLEESNMEFGRLNAIFNPNVQNSTIQKQRQRSDSYIVDPEKQIGFRKKLALSAQAQIKNERAKYNIWKIKKSLYEEGIFSRYTYNMLVGKGNTFESLHNMKATATINEEAFFTANIAEQEKSEENLSSDNLTGKPEVQNVDKPNDNETFNSATSSAAFISMTNNIKMFKIKLRSLNTPKLLYWLNVGLILLILLMGGFSIWLELQEMKQTELGEIYFTKGVESTWAIDSLLMGKVMMQKIQHLTNSISTLNTNYSNQTQTQLLRLTAIYLNVSHEILSVQLFEFSELQKKDPSLLSYLFMPVVKNETMTSGSSMEKLQVIQFMMREENFAKKGINVRNEKEIKYLLDQHEGVFEDNIYYNKLEKLDMNIFFAGFAAFIIALIVSIPIVYKIESKVEEIMYLISKISLNQRKKYYLQFTLLSEELKNMPQTQSWGELQGIQQAKIYNLQMKGNLGEQAFTEEKSQEKSPLLPKTQLKTVQTKFYQTIYFKIVLIYLVYLAVYCAKCVYVKVIFDDFLEQNDVFASIMTQKLKMTNQALLFNQYLTDQDTTGLNIRSSNLVEIIYDSYHLESKSSFTYDEFIDNLTTSDICLKIKDHLNGESSVVPYLDYLKFRFSQQISECQQLSNSSLSKGLFTTLDFIKQKRLDIISQSLGSRMNFSKSPESISLQKLTHYSNTMVYVIQQELKNQVRHKKSSLMFQMSLWLMVVGGVLLLFTIAWIFIYLNIAERASYINAFLLLIPYEILSENPYIKLYIKNEFDYKASVY